MTDDIIAGVDIGSSNTSVIIAKLSEEDESPRILGFSSGRSKGVRKGQIVDIHQVTDIVERVVDKAERMAGTKIQSAYVGVGGPHIESLNSHGIVAVSAPDVEIADGDVERAIEGARAISISSTKEVIEIIPREYIVDGQPGIKNPVGMSGVRLEVNTHIITASLTNLKNTERVLSDLGIGIKGNVFSGLASSLSTLSETEKELGVVLADIGGGKIDICIFIEGALSYSTSIPIGDRHVINDIAVGLRISLESAEKIRLLLNKYNKESAGKPLANFKSKDDIDIKDLHLSEGLSSFSYKTVVDGIVKPRLEEMLEEILAHIEKSGFITQVPSGLVITGGGATLIGVKEIAKRSVGMPARIGVPQGITGLVDEVLYPQYSALVGLLLYGQGNLIQGGRMDLKDFDKIFRNFSFKGSVKKVTNIFKSFIP